MIQWMLTIWSLVPLPFLNPAWTSGSSRFMYCWSLVWRILSITLVVCEMSTVVRYDRYPPSFIMQNNFIALEILCALWTLPLLILDRYWSFYCLHSFAFSWMSYNWNHSVCSLFRWLLSLSYIHLIFPQCLFMAWQLIFFFCTIWIYHSVFVHLLKDILVASKFLPLWTKLL